MFGFLRTLHSLMCRKIQVRRCSDATHLICLLGFTWDFDNVSFFIWSSKNSNVFGQPDQIWWNFKQNERIDGSWCTRNFCLYCISMWAFTTPITMFIADGFWTCWVCLHLQSCYLCRPFQSAASVPIPCQLSVWKHHHIFHIHQLFDCMILDSSTIGQQGSRSLHAANRSFLACNISFKSNVQLVLYQASKRNVITIASHHSDTFQCALLRRGIELTVQRIWPWYKIECREGEGRVMKSQSHCQINRWACALTPIGTDTCASCFHDGTPACRPWTRLFE